MARKSYLGLLIRHYLFFFYWNWPKLLATGWTSVPSAVCAWVRADNAEWRSRAALPSNDARQPCSGNPLPEPGQLWADDAVWGSPRRRCGDSACQPNDTESCNTRTRAGHSEWAWVRAWRRYGRPAEQPAGELGEHVSSPMLPVHSPDDPVSKSTRRTSDTLHPKRAHWANGPWDQGYQWGFESTAAKYDEHERFSRFEPAG